MTDAATITTETRGHVFLVGLNRPQKLNSFTPEMIRELAVAYTHYEEQDDLRCAVLFAHGKDFTSGLDLAKCAPIVQKGGSLWPVSGIDPLGLEARERSKPV